MASVRWKIAEIIGFNVLAGIGMVSLAFDHPKIALWCGVGYFLLVCLIDMLKDILRVLAGEKVYIVRFWKRLGAGD